MTPHTALAAEPITETFCSDCDRVHAETRKLEPWKRRCLAVPIRPGHGFVDPDYSPSPPYEKCDRVNRDGHCPMFQPRRDTDAK